MQVFRIFWFYFLFLVLLRCCVSVPVSKIDIWSGNVNSTNEGYLGSNFGNRNDGINSIDISRFPRGMYNANTGCPNEE